MPEVSGCYPGLWGLGTVILKKNEKQVSCTLSRPKIHCAAELAFNSRFCLCLLRDGLQHLPPHPASTPFIGEEAVPADVCSGF